MCAWALHTRVFQTLTKTVYHIFSASGSLSSQFKGTVSFLQGNWFHSFREQALLSLSSSLHLCSAHPLSSNLQLLRHWRTGPIIGTLRLTLEQNARRFKAACQSAFRTNSSQQLLRLFIHISRTVWLRDKGWNECHIY